MVIKDFLYYDIDKAFSIYSQIEDGLENSVQTSQHINENLSPSVGANVIGLKFGIDVEKSMT